MSVRKSLKTSFHRVTNGLGLKIVKYRPYPPEFDELTGFLERRNIRFVLDVGANEGQFATKLFAAGYTGTIISFEPMPDEHKTLAKNAAGNPRWIVAPAVALSNRSGTAEFHVAGNSISSSLLPMGDLHLAAAPQSVEVRKIKVALDRLDAMLDALVPEGDVLLKIDTQGTEMDVLEGASGALDRIVGIKTEMSFVSLYEGQPLFIEVYEKITALGFKLADITPGFRRRINAQDLLQCDGVFLKPTAK